MYLFISFLAVTTSKWEIFEQPEETKKSVFQSRKDFLIPLSPLVWSECDVCVKGRGQWWWQEPPLRRQPELLQPHEGWRGHESQVIRNERGETHQAQRDWGHFQLRRVAVIRFVASSFTFYFPSRLKWWNSRTSLNLGKDPKSPVRVFRSRWSTTGTNCCRRYAAESTGIIYGSAGLWRNVLLLFVRKRRRKN